MQVLIWVWPFNWYFKWQAALAVNRMLEEEVKRLNKELTSQAMAHSLTMNAVSNAMMSIYTNSVKR